MSVRRRGLFTIFTLMISLVLHAEDCSKFAVQDTYSTKTDSQAYEQVKDALCHTQFTEDRQAFDAAVKANIPIPVLDDVFALGFDGKTARSSFSSWKDLYCKSTYSETATRLQHSSIAMYWSQTAVAIIKSCFENQNNAVAGSAIISDDASRFIIKFRAIGTEYLKSVRIDPADAVDCDSTNPMKLSAYYRYLGNFEISGKTNEFSCGWKNKTTTVTLTFKNQGSRVILLDRLLPPVRSEPPLPIKDVWVVDPETSSQIHKSGNGHDWSGPWNICTSTARRLSADYLIPDDLSVISFFVTGDRTCGAGAECDLAVRTSKEVCYALYLQGHDESKPGIRESEGHLIVNWQHRVPVKSLETKK